MRRYLGWLSGLGLLAVALPAHAADLWVDAAAASGGDGTSAKPFQTVNLAKAALQTGDTLWIHGGTYAETVDFWHVPGAVGARTRIRAVASETPVIDGGGTPDFVLQAGETPNMTFEGLTIRNGGTGIEFYQADGGEVLGCTTQATGGSVAFYFASHGYVSKSKLEGSVSGKATDGTIVEDSEVYGSAAEGIALHADSKNCRYSRNVVHDNSSVNIYLDSISDTVVDGNLVYMTLPTTKTTVGIMLADESYPNVTAPVLRGITLMNNVVLHNESGIRFWDGSFPGQSALRDVTIDSNTVVDNQTSALKWDSGPHTGTVVRNNVFAGQAGKTALLLQANSTTGVLLDHNLWFLPSVTEPFLWGVTTYDHAGFGAATGQASGDVTADPGFVGGWDLPASNLGLGPGSKAIDAASGGSVDHDFEGAARPFGVASDLGAFEYGAVVPDGGGVTGPGAGGAGNGGGSGPGGATSGAGAGGVTGGAGQGSGSGGAPASTAGGTSGAAGTATADGGSVRSLASRDSSGCGCRAARGGGVPASWAVALLLFARRRRGRSRPRSAAGRELPV